MHLWAIMMEALVETVLILSLVIFIIGTALLLRRGRLEVGHTRR